MARRSCDGAGLLEAFRAAVANLEASVDEVNGLNVFPVPDGDTGNNMFATARAALDEAERADAATVERVASAASFGALMGARGNSGVIASQILRGFSEALAGKRRINGLDLAHALREASRPAYGAVARPVEGTILTVIREAADAAVEQAERPLGDLGFTRTPSEDDPRRDPKLLEAIAKIAPGTELRQGVDDVIRSHEGALLVIGDPNELAFLYSGGIRLDAPFRSQLLYELAKMDGAIIVDGPIRRLAWANVQLMPDPTIPSDETGTRHRTAERVAKQTGALVVSVSQQRETVTVFVGAARYPLDPVADVLAKTHQALGTLEPYRQRLEQSLTRLMEDLGRQPGDVSLLARIEPVFPMARTLPSEVRTWRPQNG